MTRVIVQVIHTFLVDTESVQEAAKLALASIKVEPQPGVLTAGRRLNALDPFEDHFWEDHQV